LGSFKGVLVGSSVESRSRTGPSVALRATLTPYSILRNLLKIHSSNSAPTLLFQGLSKSPSLGAFSALDNNHFQSRGITTQKSGETTQDVIQNTPKSGIIKEFPLGNSGENTQSIQNNIQGGGNTTQDDSYTSIYINQNFNLGNTSQGVQNTPKSVHNAQKSIVNTQKSGNTTQKIVHYPMFLWETSDGYRVEELNELVEKSLGRYGVEDLEDLRIQNIYDKVGDYRKGLRGGIEKGINLISKTYYEKRIIPRDEDKSSEIVFIGTGGNNEIDDYYLNVLYDMGNPIEVLIRNFSGNAGDCIDLELYKMETVGDKIIDEVLSGRYIIRCMSTYMDFGVNESRLELIKVI
jgi:hypothetical protein